MNFINWLESFNYPNDLFLNPENNEKSFEELFEELKKEGGDIIGSGKYGFVMYHPKWPYVIKILYNDDIYISFARFVYRNPHSAFPKLFGPPQKIVPNFKRFKYQAKMYVIRLEKLYPISKNLFDMIDKYQNHFINYIIAKKQGTENEEVEVRLPRHLRTGKPVFDKVHQFAINEIDKNPKLLPFFEGLLIILNSELKGSLDFHDGNIMMRKNGDIVLIDPLWHGSNPYMDYLQQQKLEIDDIPEYEYKPPTLIGGKLPKKPKPKKFKPFVYPKDDDTPF